MNALWRAARCGIAFLAISVLYQVPCGWAGEEQSERLYTQGLIPFHQGEEAFDKALETGDERHRARGKKLMEEALSLFQKAAAEVPPYDLAVYYLGVTYGKLGRYGEAAPYLEKTLEKRPAFAPARQDLAVAFYHLGRYEQALAFFEKAAAEQPQNGLVHYYAGLCHAGLKHYAAAIVSLDRAAELDPKIRPYAYYYKGLAQLARGEREDATLSLQTAGSSAQDMETARRSLELSREVSAPPERRMAGKRWELRMGAASEYDSNVVLEPDIGSAPEQISDQDDFRFIFSAGGTLDLLRTRAAYLTGDYDFYQSLHLELDDFDVQAHNFRLTAGWSPLRSLDLSLQGGTNYYNVGGDSYLFETYAMPALGFSIKPWEYTQLAYRWAVQDYLIFFYDPARDGNRHEIALRQYFLLKGFERYFFVGYHFDMEDPGEEGGEDFQYRGNLAEVGLHFPVPWEATVDLIYSYHNKDYEFPNSRSSPPFSEKRNDDEHRISLTLRKSLTPAVEVYGNFRVTVNDSNIDVFEYDRHISALGILLRF